ncbi:hypothetical protein SDC9_149145 [bioreactor metagenome]|uniref:Uncharacterized protein n=1 Tax=bioreactor metagenome TaxID=1076179 RepID=A0A645EKZ1_9ZZZZ
MIGNTKFIAEPATITSILAQIGFALNERSSCSSSGSIPAILLNPPRGIILKEYTVSPYLRLNTLGPNPIANSSTRIPTDFAVRKCPSSWKNINSPKTKIVAINVDNNIPPAYTNIFSLFKTSRI